MPVFLKIIGGKNDGREIKISVPEFIIGRGDTAHLKPSSDLVSRRHCSIKVVDGEVIIADMGSRNGTFVNGEQLKSEHVAKPGDRIRVGRLQFEMVLDVAKASVKKEKVKNAVEAASRTVEAKKTGSLEDSITDWLSDDVDASPFDDDDDEDFNPQDTVQLSDAETQEFLIKAESSEPADEESEATEESPSNWRKDGKGKLPPVPKSEHADSTNAAGDVLKQFFNRR